MSKAPQRPGASAGSTRNVAASFAGMLDSGELLTGTPIITERTTSDLTIGSKVVSTDILIINGKSVAIGEAVQASVSGFVADNFPYTLDIIVSTDASPPQTFVGEIVINKGS